MAPALSPAIADRPRKFSIDSRFVAPILISVILLIGHLTFGILEDWRRTALCVLLSIATEAALGFLTTRKLPHLASAYVSGISCGILIRSTEWWPYILAPMISIASKYVIRVDGRHLWNPSNLAIALLLFLAPNTVASLSIQWSNSVWPMAIIWTLGSIIVARLGRFHICLTYVASFLGYAFLRTLFTHQSFWFEVAPITGPMYQLFIFFMITDPKTTTQSRWGQMTVAFLIATAESAIRFWGPQLGFTHWAAHAPYYALTLMGPSANLIEIFLKRRAKSRAAASTNDTARLEESPATARPEAVGAR